MLKGLFIFFAIALGSSAYASPYSLKDPAILGKYVLSQTNKLSNIQTAEIRFDADEKLALFISHTGDTINLEKIEKDGLVYSSDQTGDDCDSDECATAEGSDLQKIRLVRGPQGHPQLIIDITWNDTLDENNKNGETVTYVLDWSSTIPNAVSFYLNMDTPPALQKVIDSCVAIVEPALSDEGPISSEYEVCPSVSAVKYRATIEEAMPWYLKESGGRGAVEVAVADLQVSLSDEVEYLEKLPSKGLKVKPAKIAGAFSKVADYLNKHADRVYRRDNEGAYTYYVIDTDAQTIMALDLAKR